MGGLVRDSESASWTAAQRHLAGKKALNKQNIFLSWVRVAATDKADRLLTHLAVALCKRNVMDEDVAAVGAGPRLEAAHVVAPGHRERLGEAVAARVVRVAVAQMPLAGHGAHVARAVAQHLGQRFFGKGQAARVAVAQDRDEAEAHREAARQERRAARRADRRRRVEVREPQALGGERREVRRVGRVERRALVVGQVAVARVVEVEDEQVRPAEAVVFAGVFSRCRRVGARRVERGRLRDASGMRMVPFRLVDGAMADGAMAGRRLGSDAGAGGDDEPEDHHRRRSSPFKARAIVSRHAT